MLRLRRAVEATSTTASRTSSSEVRMLRELLASIVLVILPGEPEVHALVRNADFVEFGSLCDETVTQVEMESVDLRMQVNRFESLTARLPHEPLQKSFPYAQSTILLQDCKAANLTGGFQTPRANCVTFPCQGKGMHTNQIGAVPLILLGNLLLNDKTGTCDVLQRLPVLQPCCRDNREICVDEPSATLDFARELRREAKVALRCQFEQTSPRILGQFKRRNESEQLLSIYGA